MQTPTQPPNTKPKSSQTTTQTPLPRPKRFVIVAFFILIPKLPPTLTYINLTRTGFDGREKNDNSINSVFSAHTPKGGALRNQQICPMQTAGQLSRKGAKQQPDLTFQLDSNGALKNLFSPPLTSAVKINFWSSCSLDPRATKRKAGAHIKEGIALRSHAGGKTKMQNITIGKNIESLQGERRTMNESRDEKLPSHEAGALSVLSYPSMS
jgi:hypothetical protein